MNTMFRIFLRATFLVIIAMLLGLGGMMAWFSSWRMEKLSQLHAASTFVETPAGKIEFAQSGEGPVVLVFHGAPGGFDQAMLYGSVLAESGFHIIAPSRPGYLQTPLSVGFTPEDQADAMVALLDSLGINRVAVLGISLGTPIAIEFARRHPDRTWALVLLSAVTKQLPQQPMNSPIPEVLNKRLTGDMGSWFFLKMTDHDLSKTLRWTFDFAQSGDAEAREAWVQAVLKNSTQAEWFRNLAETIAPLSPRETGLRNDLLQLRALANVPYEKLNVPTLFVHGAADSWLPLGDIEAVKKRMPQAEIFAVSGTGHLVELGPDSAPVMEKILEFLNCFSDKKSAP